MKQLNTGPDIKLLLILLHAIMLNKCKISFFLILLNYRIMISFPCSGLGTWYVHYYAISLLLFPSPTPFGLFLVGWHLLEVCKSEEAQTMQEFL